MSRRDVARRLGISRDTVSKMCRYAAPPGYVRTKPVDRPKLGPLIGAIDAILDADDKAPVKQRHTAKRIWRRLRDEHGFAGGYTTVKDYVRRVRARLSEIARDVSGTGATAFIAMEQLADEVQALIVRLRSETDSKIRTAIAKELSRDRALLDRLSEFVSGRRLAPSLRGAA